MLFGQYFKYFTLFFTALLVSEQIPLIKTIDPGSSEASQLLSALSEYANEAKDNIVEMVTRPTDFFHGDENDQSPLVLAPSPPPPASPAQESPPESPPELPLSPETMPLEKSTSQFWRLDGSKIILELDLERVPGFGVMRNVVVWVTHWFGVLFPSGSGVDWVGQSYWLHVLVPAALGFFGGLGYGLVGWCRWYLAGRKVHQVVGEKVKQVGNSEQMERRAPANAYCECFLWVFQHSEFWFIDRVT